MVPSACLRTARLTLLKAASLLAKSSRKCAPRLSLRSIAERVIASETLGKFGREFAGAFAEDKQVGERIAAETISAVYTRSAFARRKKTGHAGRLCVSIDMDSAHDVMRGRADFHRFARDVDVGQLLELV